MEELRRQVYELQQELSAVRSDVRALQVQEENRRVREATAPTWLFGVITAVVSVGALLVQLFVQFGGKAP